MNTTELRAAISADPELLALVPDAGTIASKMSEGRVRPVQRYSGVGAVMEALGPDVGAAVLDGIKVLSESVPSIKYAWMLLDRGALDFGSAATRAQLDALVLAGHLTETQVKSLKAIAEVEDPISEISVRRAIWNDDGSRAL